MQQRTIVLVLTLILPTLALAQTQSKWECSWGRFVRGSKVLFHDSLDAAPSNTRGSQWQAISASDGIIKRVDGRNIRCFYSPKVNAMPTSQNAVGKWVTFESDFILYDTSSSFQVVFTYGSAGERKILVGYRSLWQQWSGEHEANYGIGSFGASLNCPNCFQADVNKWHHLALIFSRDCMDAFIDGKRLLGLGHDTQSIPQFIGYRPTNFYIAGRGPFAVADIHFAESDEVPSNFTSSLDQLTTNKKLSTQAITFDFNKADIKPESMVFITQLADWLKEHPNLKLQVQGHTDNTGTPEFNQKLSEERANEVKQKLISLSIPATHITTKGFGAAKPVAPNDTEEHKAANRRVEFVTTP